MMPSSLPASPSSPTNAPESNHEAMPTDVSVNEGHPEVIVFHSPATPASAPPAAVPSAPPLKL
jgi:hypothetical protein